MIHNEKGGVTLEAALIMPMFLAFILTLALFIRLAVVEMALQSAASESTKLIATHLYPVELLLAEAKTKFGDSQIGRGINEVLDRGRSAQNNIEQAEKFVDDYAAWIPEPLAQLVQWEKELRESAANKSGEALDEFRSTILDPKLRAAMKPVVRLFADMAILDDDRLTVSQIVWPSFDDREKAYLGIQLEYRFPFRLPFFSQDITIRGQAYERVWLGT